MWLSNSSVGRKFIMAITGAVLVLFVTFHCLMNAVAICWPAAYNAVCMFLGANWYALIASAGLALFILLHIIYAVMLTLQNRKARGPHAYLVSKRPASVEWSSKNMFVLGLVILAFLVVHLIQFWAKMQLVEVLGCEGTIPPMAGTLFIQEAFAQPWTLIVYAIGFIALWFHLNHGMWSMFQSVGWNNGVWMSRLKCIAKWWTSIIVLLFLAEAVVFTVKASQNFYLTDPDLREQYKEMIPEMIEDGFGPEAKQLGMQIEMSSFEQMSMGLRQMNGQLGSQLEQMSTPEGKQYISSNPEMGERIEEMRKQSESLENVVRFLDYLESADNQPNNQLPPSMGGAAN